MSRKTDKCTMKQQSTNLKSGVKQAVPYLEASCLNSSIILQHQIYNLQLDQLKYLTNDNRHFQVQDLSIADALLIPSRRFGNSRCLDNEEITLLSLLDSDGRLSMSNRMTQFMILMTRITRMDHRALLIEILSQHTSDQCEKQFVLHGGLRLLKLWIKIAEDENNLHELIALVRVCRKLPFIEKSVKETGGIGKSIKKLLKYKNSSSDLGVLYDEVRSLMEHWTQQAQVELASKKLDDKNSLKIEELPQITTLISEKMVEERGLPVVVPEKQQVVPPEQKEAVKKVESVSSLNVKTLTSAPTPTTTPATSNNPLPKHKVESIIESKGETAMEVESRGGVGSGALTLQPPSKGQLFPFPQQPILPVKVQAAIPAVVREKKVSDMAEGARKLLAMKAQAQLKPTETTISGADGVEPPTEKERKIGSLFPANSSANTFIKVSDGHGTPTAAVLPIKPLKSAIKKTSMIVDNSNKEKKTINIRWADEHGLSLREVHTIEVEKIKNSIANYKSHRDLVKKERQLEKETHLSKVHDAMQRTTEWRQPKPLSLSIDVLSNREAPVESLEKEAQSRRLGLVLEVRYLDDSLIPSDPDDSIAVAFEQQQQYTEPAIIPWSNAVIDAQMMQNSSNYNPSFQQYDDLDNFRGYPGKDMMNESPAVAGLPLSLLRLEPQLLQRIVADPALLQSLLNPDGKINERKVQQLEEESRSFDDRQYPPQHRSQARYDYDGGNFSNDGRYTDSDYRNRDMMADRYPDSRGPGPFPPQQGYRSTRFGDKPNLPYYDLPPVGPVDGNVNSGRPRNTRWGDKAQLGGDLRPPPFQDDYNGGFDPSYPPRRDRDNMLPEDDFGRVPRFLDDRDRAGFDSREPMYGSSDPLSLSQASMPPLDGVVGAFPYPDELGDGSGNYNQPRRKPAAKQTRFPSAKAAVPCRFFNTRKGCQFGDKCEFGHFAGISGNAPLPLPVGGGGFAADSGVSGPGSRQHHFKGPGGGGGGIVGAVGGAPIGGFDGDVGIGPDGRLTFPDDDNIMQQKRARR